MYKAVEWQSGGGSWYVADVQDIKNNSGHWSNAAKAANLSFGDFVKCLVEEYHVDRINYSADKDFLFFSWNAEHYAYAHKYLLWINKCGRKNS